MLLGNGCRLLAVVATELFGVFHLERLGSECCLAIPAGMAGRI